VALTRAEDRLYIAGWRSKITPPEGCWYNLVARGLAAAAGSQTADIDLTLVAGESGWKGRGVRLESTQQAAPRPDERLPALLDPAHAPLPTWVRRPPQPEPSPARPLAPSRPRLPDPGARSPLGADQGAGLLRGRLVHRLLQSLPDLAPDARRVAARRFLELPVHGLSAAERDEVVDETLAVMSDPEFGPIFGPGSQAEVPVVGLLGGRALAGQIDRLVVSQDAVLIVDYKTLRPPPRDEREVPAAYLDQLAAYRAAIAAVYAGREVRCALLWTEGPRLMPISGALLDGHGP
jgi:ATP-dependent helicase/nuclease subunit A